MLLSGFLIVLPLTVRGYDFSYDNQYGPNRQFSLYTDEPVSVESWEQVPMTSPFPNLPSGCVCVNELESNMTCTAFRCPETCNLNHGSCDVGCCTDPDCSVDEVKQFTLAGLCTVNAPYMITRCTDTSSLEKVNEKYGMYVETDPLSTILCVSVENSPYEGEFYTPHPELINNPDVLSRTIYQPDHSFTVSQYGESPTAQVYEKGAAIAAAISSADTLTDIGYLSLPTAGPDGSCQTTNFVQYSNDVQRNRCVQHIFNLSSACQQVYGAITPSSYFGSLRIGSSPLSTTNAPQGFIQVVPTEMYGVDLSTHSRVRIWTSEATYSPTASPTSTPTKSPSLVPTAPTFTGAPSAAVRRQLSGIPIPAATWNAATSTCENAIVGVAYTISVSSTGIITQVDASISVANISSTGSASFSQEFNVYFQNAVLNPNVTVPRVVSGNPGYIVGLPVQAGNTVTNGTASAVEYSPTGLTMMTAGGPRGQCFLGTLPWYESLATQSGSKTPVLFGVDTSSSCSVKMTFETFQSELVSWCQDYTRSPIFQLTESVLGIYGNANPLKEWDWIRVSFLYDNVIAPQPSASTTSPICVNMVSSMNIEILWMKSGQVNNPQPMILSARVVYGQSDWKWRSVQSSEQTFTFTSSVSFIEHGLTDSDTNNYKPEVPPLIPGIPSDVFYPFDIKSSATRTSLALFTFFFILFSITK